MKEKIIIYWSRRDFRLRDNPALQKAVAESAQSKRPLLSLFILENYMCRGNPQDQFGYPQRLFLAHALPSFASRIPGFTIASGTVPHYFKKLLKTFEIELFVNEDVHPDFYQQVRLLISQKIAVHVLKDHMSIERNTKTGAGQRYSVFTPFKRAVWSDFISSPEAPSVNVHTLTKLTENQYAHVPDRVPADTHTILSHFSSTRSLCVGQKVLPLDFLPEYSIGTWYTSEAQALQRFTWFLDSGGLTRYHTARDMLESDVDRDTVNGMTMEGHTSRMSLALTWGLVSARTLKNEILSRSTSSLAHPDSLGNPGALSFISELIWREFYKYLYYHNPDLQNREFQEKFRGTIAWAAPQEAYNRFNAWMQGKTGYPLVDAAMNQLMQTGWMHNRARMVVASVLTKNLGVDWRWGQEYFRATLIDLDEASNNGGWQWGASVGADPKPIRIFNPELQAKNYDSSGAYRKQWLPAHYSITPLVPHTSARAEALERYGLSKKVLPRDY